MLLRPRKPPGPGGGGRCWRSWDCWCGAASHAPPTPSPPPRALVGLASPLLNSLSSPSVSLPHLPGSVLGCGHLCHCPQTAAELIPWTLVLGPLTRCLSGYLTGKPHPSRKPFPRGPLSRHVLFFHLLLQCSLGVCCPGTWLTSTLSVLLCIQVSTCLLDLTVPKPLRLCTFRTGSPSP